VLRLSGALSGWKPSESLACKDPLVLLLAGWSEIVGADVADNSAPVRISNGTLVVVTRSSAWSHQLSFLAERLLAALASRLPAAGIERLRFRVGTIPKHSRRQPTARARTARAATAERLEPSASPEEALLRFRRSVQQSQSARRAAGWQACASCGALCDGVAQSCATCEAAGRERRELVTARLLFEAPWLGFPGTAELVDGLCLEEYERIRRRLLRRWWGVLEQSRAAGRLSRDGRERLIASSYVVLRSKLPPETIAPATVRSVLGDELHEMLYGNDRNR